MGNWAKYDQSASGTEAHATIQRIALSDSIYPKQWRAKMGRGAQPPQLLPVIQGKLVIRPHITLVNKLHSGELKNLDPPIFNALCKPLIQCIITQMENFLADG